MHAFIPRDPRGAIIGNHLILFYKALASVQCRPAPPLPCVPVVCAATHPSTSTTRPAKQLPCFHNGEQGVCVQWKEWPLLRTVGPCPGSPLTPRRCKQARAEFKLRPLLKAKIGIRSSYAATDAQARKFAQLWCGPHAPLYLLADDVLTIFPDGCITHELWSSGGRWFRLHERNGRYLAVEELGGQGQLALLQDLQARSTSRDKELVFQLMVKIAWALRPQLALLQQGSFSDQEVWRTAEAEVLLQQVGRGGEGHACMATACNPPAHPAHGIDQQLHACAGGRRGRVPLRIC